MLATYILSRQIEFALVEKGNAIWGKKRNMHGANEDGAIYRQSKTFRQNCSILDS